MQAGVGVFAAKKEGMHYRKDQDRHVATQNSGRTVRRGHCENLKPWPKGVSGNPGGRPKTRLLTEAIRELLGQEVPRDSEGRTYAQRIAEVLAKQALKGNVQAVRELADRSEGKSRQSIELGVKDDPFLNKSDEELLYFGRTGLWPTPEECEYYKAHGRWPQDEQRTT